MPRPKNEGLHRNVERAAYQIFLKEGYDAASYQRIADLAKTTRTNVQYFVSTKESLAISFMEEILALAERYTTESLGFKRATYLGLFAVSQFSFYLAFRPEGLRAFALDILRDRDLTSEMLKLDIRWAYEYDNEAVPTSLSTVEDDILMSMGGFYELLYWHLKSETPFDYRYYLRQVILATGKAKKVDSDLLKEVERAPLLLDKTLEEGSSFIIRNLFSE